MLMITFDIMINLIKKGFFDVFTFDRETERVLAGEGQRETRDTESKPGSRL